MVRICEVLTTSVSTSFFIIKPHPWIISRRKPLPLPAFPSLLSVHHDPLPWNYYSIDQISTFQTHLLRVGTYILGSLLFFFSLLCFSWVLLTHISVHDMTHIPIACNSFLTEKLCSQRTRDNQPPCDVSAAHLFFFETRKPKRPFALKKAENEQLGLDNQDTSTLHMHASAHQSVAPTQSGASFVN